MTNPLVPKPRRAKKSNLLLTPEGRECAQCLEFKTWDQYTISRTKLNKTGHLSYCKDCNARMSQAKTYGYSLRQYREMIQEHGPDWIPDKERAPDRTDIYCNYYTGEKQEKAQRKLTKIPRALTIRAQEYAKATHQSFSVVISTALELYLNLSTESF